MLANMVEAAELVYCWESNGCDKKEKKQIEKNINTETIKSRVFA